MKIVTDPTSKGCLFIPQHLLNTCSVAGAVFGAGDTTMDKKNKTLPLGANVLPGLKNIIYIKHLV